MQTDTADYLNVEVLHFEYAPACFAERGERVEKNIVKRFTLCEPVL